MPRSAHPDLLRGPWAGALVIVVLGVLASLPGRGRGAETAVDDAGATAPVEEIRVIGRRPGDPEALEPTKEELLRRSIIRDWARQRARAEEEAWRRALPRARELPGSPGVRWGYDPDAEQRQRMRTLVDESTTRADTRPPTLIRIDF